MSSSSLYTSRATYAFLSLPNSFQISALIELPGGGAERRFAGGGEGLDEGVRGRFLKDAAVGTLADDPAALEGATPGREPAGAVLLVEGAAFEAAAFPLADLEAVPLALAFSAGRLRDLTETDTPEPLLRAGPVGRDVAVA